MFNLNNIQLSRLLPPNIAKDLNIKAICYAVDEEFKILAVEVNKVLIIPAIDNIEDEALLDELAYQFHVDYYNTNFDIKTKKGLIKNYYRWHKLKGTGASIEELITLVFGDGDIEEWFEYKGEPYHFRVATNDADVYSNHVDELYRAIMANKRLTSILDGIILQSKTSIFIETKSEYYKYSSAFAGTKPDISTFGFSHLAINEIMTKTESFKIKSLMTNETIMSGTIPYESKPGDEGELIGEFSLTSESFTIVSTYCGTGYTK